MNGRFATAIEEGLPAPARHFVALERLVACYVEQHNTVLPHARVPMLARNE